MLIEPFEFVKTHEKATTGAKGEAMATPSI